MVSRVTVYSENYLNLYELFGYPIDTTQIFVRKLEVKCVGTSCFKKIKKEKKEKELA